jgi:hypothetical protein
VIREGGKALYGPLGRQARLPSFEVVRLLMNEAESQNWGHFDAETLEESAAWLERQGALVDRVTGAAYWPNGKAAPEQETKAAMLAAQLRHWKWAAADQGYQSWFSISKTSSASPRLGVSAGLRTPSISSTRRSDGSLPRL